MTETINIYCDESCHLEHDHQQVMVLGVVWCPAIKTKDISQHLKDIKKQYNLPSQFEIKWTKVSPAKLTFYQDILKYFFDDDDLHFRSLIVPDKTILHHVDYNQTHEDFYYKMYFDTLKIIFHPKERYRIYIDMKDTRGGNRINKLHEVLSNNLYDFDKTIIERIQIARSYEIQLLQLTDFLTGIISAANRSITQSSAKLSLIQQMKERSHYSLIRTTLIRENKVNIFRWHPREAST